MGSTDIYRQAAILQMVAEQLRCAHASQERAALEAISGTIERVAATLLCGEPQAILAKG